MFSSSARRVAWTAPSIPMSFPFATSAARATASQALSYRSHQRRYSSSKPSSPADGSRGVNQGQSVPATQARPDGEKKPAKASKKKVRDGASSGKGKDETVQNLPSVPSTQHITPLQISASDFFSLHRPMSLTNSFPKAITEEAFAAIFEPRVGVNARQVGVISTLSRTLENLDMATGDLKNFKIGTQQEQWNEEVDELRLAINAESAQKSNAQHLDAAPEEPSLFFPRHILSGKYRPFNAPPPPTPIDTLESLVARVGSLPPGTQHRTYTAVLTIEESTHENGDVTYEAHSSPLVDNDRPLATRFLERMQVRQERYRLQQAAVLSGMLAISVKRQRKLKMKKHKYKKLMRRTRNLRRRLDRN